MALRHEESKLRDPRLKALVVLVDDFLHSLSKEDRQLFLQELRNQWCERCGRSESAPCKEGWCHLLYDARYDKIREHYDQKVQPVFVNDRELESLKMILKQVYLSDFGSSIVDDARAILRRIK